MRGLALRCGTCERTEVFVAWPGLTFSPVGRALEHAHELRERVAELAYTRLP